MFAFIFVAAAFNLADHHVDGYGSPFEATVSPIVHETLDAIVAAGPFGAPAATLLALPPTGGRTIYQPWVQHFHLQTDTTGARTETVWSVSSADTARGAALLGVIEERFVLGQEATPTVKVRVVCPDGTETVTEKVALTVGEPPEINLAGTAVRVARGAPEGLSNGCALETLTTFVRQPIFVERPYDSGVWHFGDGYVDQRYTMSAAPGVPVLAATGAVGEPYSLVEVREEPNGGQSVSYGRRRLTVPAVSTLAHTGFSFRVGSVTHADMAEACAAQVEPALERAVASPPLPKVPRGRTRLHTIRAITDAVRDGLTLDDVDWYQQGFAIPDIPTVMARSHASPFDRAFVLAAALRHHGMVAHIGFKAASGEAGRVDFEVPSPLGFRHPFVVVAATSRDPEVWIEVLTDTLPAGLLSRNRYLERGWLCAMRPGSPPGLVEMPRRTDLRGAIHVEKRASLNLVAEPHVFVTIRYEGVDADLIRGRLRGETVDAMKDEFGWLPDRGFGGIVTSVNVVEDGGVGPLTVAAEVVGGDAGIGLSEAAILLSAYDPWNEIPDEVDDGGTGPIVLKHSQVISSESIFEVPNGFEPNGAIPAVDQALGPARWRHTTTFTPGQGSRRGVIRTKASLELGPVDWTAADLEAFRADRGKYAPQWPSTLALNNGHLAQLMAGDFAAGGPALQRLLTAHPRDATLYAQLAWIWAVHGLGPLATDAVERALALDPKNPAAHFVDALVRETGGTSGHYVGVEDRDKVLLAWRRAFELAPRDRQTERYLALTLTGVDTPWSPVTPDEFEEGFGRLRAMALVDRDEETFEPYLRVLWHTRQTALLLEQAASMKLDSEGLTLVAAATLVEKGMNEFRAFRSGLLESDYTLTEIATAALTMPSALMAAGYWRELVALDALRSHEEILEPLAALEPRPRELGPPALDRRDPRSVARAYLLALYGTYAYALPSIRPTLTGLVAPDYRDAVPHWLGPHALGSRARGPFGLIPLEEAIRLRLGMDDVRLAGDVDVGMRLIVTLEDQDVSVYMVRDNADRDEWRVVPSQCGGGYLYHQAFLAAKASKPEAAALWFRWAESERLASMEGATPPAAPKDLGSMVAAAARWTIGCVSDEAAILTTKMTLADDDLAAWEDLGNVLSFLELDDEALAAFAHLPESKRATSEAAILSMLRMMPRNKAQAWLEANVSTISADVRLAQKLFRVYEHFEGMPGYLEALQTRYKLGEPGIANNLAWAAHAEGRTTEETERLVRLEIKSIRLVDVVTLRQRVPRVRKDKELLELQNHPSEYLRARLHTHACALLDLGKVNEALPIAAEALPRDTPPSAWDRYLMARLADETGFRDIANEIYRELEKVPGDPELTRLAKRWRTR